MLVEKRSELCCEAPCSRAALLIQLFSDSMQVLTMYSGNGYHSQRISRTRIMSNSEELPNRRSSSTGVERVNVETKLDSVWSLQPIWIWMKFMGYDLDLSVKLTTIRRYWNWFFGLIMLSITFIYNGFEIADSIGNVNSFSANTKSWNHAIIAFQEIFAGITIHLSTFIIANWYWKPLWKCIRLLDRSMSFQDAHYRKLRKFSILVLLGIMLVSCCFIKRLP